MRGIIINDVNEFYCRPPNLDIYLSPPMMDVSETPATLHHVSSNAVTSTTTSASSTVSQSELSANNIWKSWVDLDILYVN